MGLIKPVTEVYCDSGVRILRFEHTGPSRSGRATISVVIGLTDDQPMVMVAYDHHEGTHTAELDQFYVEQAFCAENELHPEWKQDVLDIVAIVRGIVASNS